jgi:hypothetical protein
MDFLDRRINHHFQIQCFVLDPERLIDPEDNQAQPQTLAPEQQPIEAGCLAGLIRVNEIPAQRGFGESQTAESVEPATRAASNRLSDQLRDYYRSHLDPADRPDPSDIGVFRENSETTLDRTCRLLYVTCSRAESSLAVILYSRDPAAVRSQATLKAGLQRVRSKF